MKKPIAYLLFDNSGSVDRDKLNVYNQVFNHYSLSHRCKLITYNIKAVSLDKMENLKSEQNGTYTSSGLSLALIQIIKLGEKNATIVLCSDGDNWSEDNEKLYNCINAAQKLGIKIIYHEIHGASYSTTMSDKINQECENPIIIYKMQKSYNKKYYYDIFGNKIYKPSQKTIVYQVQHVIDGKLYDFVNNNGIKFDINEPVICNTSRGLTYGIVKNIVEKELSEDELKQLKWIKKCEQ